MSLAPKKDHPNEGKKMKTLYVSDLDGTALRDAIRTQYKNHPKVRRIEIGLNPGQTDLVLREL